jgi:hypothetical protein
MATSFFASKNGFLAGVGGDPTPKKFSIEGFLDNIPAAALSVAVNNVGGALTNLVHTKIDSWKPGWGALGVEFVSIALKAGFQPTSDINKAIREVAAGMAGAVGGELTGELMLWWGSSAYQAGKPYKAGDVVRHSNAYWRALVDVPATSTEVPGAGKSWTRERAQGVAPAQWGLMAQAFVASPQYQQSISELVAEATAKRHALNDEEQAELANDVRQAMMTFARVVADHA